MAPSTASAVDRGFVFSPGKQRTVARSVVARGPCQEARRRKMGVDMECGLWKGTVASVDERPL
ncbi:MAG: hypothetical protein CM1200mP2_51070 [Planctomycetaceae bacterium]|nr:MAG: hypothetical protein CM1200mP2_51070 [Planctomycetaceae bacterium]